MHKAQMVKYSCGCIGLPPQSENQSIIFWDCRNGQELTQYWAGYRDMSGKTYEPVGDLEEREILTGISRLIGEGEGLRKIRDILG